MLQGTGSDAGKSLITAGLCRAFARRGLRVRPFKPQNMSNNAAVTTDGGEIGRAQALQARAAGVAPAVDMNPVLLKPQSETGAQIVVRGRVTGAASARDYAALKPKLLADVMESFHRLCRGADIVVVEGAGSPAEINLRAGDIANMGFAEAAGAPVVLVGAIDRGGVIAALTGTHGLLAGHERALVKGFLINRFRGDVSLFDDALSVIEQKTGWPGLGVIPHFGAASVLPKEDAQALEAPVSAPGAHPGAGTHADTRIKIAVPRLSRIANFDDLDPLSAEPGVIVDMVPPGRPLPLDADVVLIPGSKSTRADLDFIRAEGWDADIRALARAGAVIAGVCAGYQMLGRAVADPGGAEGPPGETPGLGLLDVTTVLGGAKTLVETRGQDARTGAPVRGYEIHIGETSGPDTLRPWLKLESAGGGGWGGSGGTGGAGGATSADGLVAGCYVHGLFASDDFRRAFLTRVRKGAFAADAWEARVESALDALAEHLETHVQVDRLLEIARPPE
ncbi:MAG: cobyric acid synthase [Rhodospirillales bacterium]